MNKRKKGQSESEEILEENGLENHAEEQWFEPEEQPRKAYKMSEFLDSPDARLIRILSEFLEPQARFRKHRISDTVVFFGSARIKAPEVSKEELKSAEARAKEGGTQEKLWLEQARRNVRMSDYYRDAAKLSQMITEWSKGLGRGKRRFIVCSGGGPGIMEAANKGAHDAKGISIGFNISIPFEKNNNRYISRELNFEFHYFFIRKYWFAYMAKALVIFPGGFGTIDELLEMMTLIQTEKIKKRIPIVIYGSEYWKSVLNFSEMVKWGTLSPKDLDLFHLSDSPQDAFDYLVGELTKSYLD